MEPRHGGRGICGGEIRDRDKPQMLQWSRATGGAEFQSNKCAYSFFYSASMEPRHGGRGIISGAFRE